MEENRRGRGGRTHRPAPGSTAAGRRMLWLMLALALAAGLFVFFLRPLVLVGSEADATVKIPTGATEAQVRDTLTKYFGKSYAADVMRMARVRPADLTKRPGAYAIPKGTSAFGTMRRLTSGAQTPVRITINGFRSLPLLTEKVAAKLDLPPDSIADVLADPAFMGRYGLTPDQAMSLFVDDTYEVYWTVSARQLLEKIGENYLYLWSDARRDRAAEAGLTPAQVMTLASIVDEETNDRREKGTIGQLYINRLHNGMRLQADPTVRYALGDYTIRRVRRRDLEIQSPYNTYLHPGLPPGPIRTTSAATVVSILDEAPNNYLYMCAREDFSGSHNFASTYSEHLDNAARYQAALDRMGIGR